MSGRTTNSENIQRLTSYKILELSKIKILIADDEDDILEFVSYNLRKEGYQVFTAKNGKEAVKKAKDHIPHLIILDVMMPEMDGIETCREIRQIPKLDDTIITFFTARDEAYSQIAGLEAGADDYIAKPIKPNLLNSKVNSLLRRQISVKAADIYLIGNLIINSEQHKVTCNGKEFDLPKKEFELLKLLTSKPNRVFTRDEIFNRVWAYNEIVGDKTIDVHIHKLRDRLGIDNIKTVKGIGYKYEYME
jgi:two-component system alkaline phosphatase synthesis response regulator PhoP